MSFKPQQQSKKLVLFFGDSITELGVKPGGYISVMDSFLTKSRPDLSFEGSGISGNKVYDLYLRLDKDVLQKNPAIVVIYIGVNDVWHKRLTGTGTDPDKFEIFYQAILDRLQEKRIQAVLCTPAMIGEKSDGSNEQDNDLNRYSTIIRRLAKNNGLPMVDLRQAFLQYNREHNKENSASGILTYDGVHLNDRGNRFVAESMWEVLKGL